MSKLRLAPRLSELVDTRTDPYWNEARIELRDLLTLARDGFNNHNPHCARSHYNIRAAVNRILARNRKRR